MAVILPLPTLDERPVLSWPERAFAIREEREVRLRLADVDAQVVHDLRHGAQLPREAQRPSGLTIAHPERLRDPLRR